MRKARMLPNDRPLTPDEIDAVARDYSKFRRELRLTHKAVSRELGEGFGPSTLSEFETGAKRGDKEKVARALNQWMEHRVRDAEVARPRGFVVTQVAKEILSVVHSLRTTGGFALVSGPAGVGKTLTLQAARSMVPGTVLLRITEGERSPSGLTAALIDTVKPKGVSRKSTLRVGIRSLIKELEGTGRLLLIDEAHKLSTRAFEVLRDITDEAGVPILLCGTHDIHSKIDDSYQFYGQFSSRTANRHDLAEAALRPKDPRPLFTVAEIRSVFASANVKLTDDAAKFLCRASNVAGLGCLRLATQLVKIAARLKSMEGKAVDEATLRRVLRQFHGAAYSEIAGRRMDDLRVRVA